MKRLVFVLALFVVWFGLPVVVNAGEVSVLTATELNMNGVALSGTPNTVAIPMDSRGRFYNQLTLVCAVTWGTTIQVDAKCKGSYDGSLYGWVDHCTGVNPKVCKPLEWQWNSTDSADGLFTLELRSNYAWYICQFDDAADQNGTIICNAGRGRQ